MEKIKNLLKNNKLYIFLLITLVFFGIFARMEYATDTYSVFEFSTEKLVLNFFQSGRFVTGAVFGLLCLVKIGNTAKYMLSFFLAIVMCLLSLYKVYKLLKKDIKSDFLAIILSTVIIINPFSIELFLFIEKGIMLLAVFLCICAVEQFVKFLEEENKLKSIVKALIFMLIATFSYQGVLAIFISLSSIYIIKYSKKIKDFILNNVVMFVCYGVPAIINFGTIRIFFDNSRVSGKIILAETIEKIAAGSEKMFQTYNILPENFYLVLVAITLAVLLISIIRNKENRIYKIFGLFYIILLNYIMTVIPIVMQDTASIWFVSRSSYAFASILGLIILYGVINVKARKNEKEKFDTIEDIIYLIIMLVLLVVQFYRFNIIEIDHYNLNYKDKINSLTIGELIKEYEQETGESITKISIYNDKNKSYTYKDIFTTGDINVSGLATNWSCIPMINYYNNLKLEEVENSKIIEDKFKEKDWDDFNKEQIVFENDTVHICIF